MRAREGDGFPSANTFARFGLKLERIARLASYCRERPGCDDVLQLLLPRLEADVAGTEPRESTTAVEWGAVYLLKSGRHYKIGRSNSADRRERELQIQLPERASRIDERTVNGSS